MPAFTVTCTPGSSPGVTVAQLHGPLLIANVPIFHAAVRTLDARLLILDCAEVTYMDSAGLGAVVQIYRDLQPAGRKLALVNLNQRVSALLKLTRADTILDVQPDVASAEKAAV